MHFQMENGLQNTIRKSAVVKAAKCDSCLAAFTKNKDNFGRIRYVCESNWEECQNEEEILRSIAVMCDFYMCMHKYK